MYGAVPQFCSSDLMPAEASCLCSGGLVTSVSSQVGKPPWVTTKMVKHGPQPEKSQAMEMKNGQTRKEKRRGRDFLGKVYAADFFLGHHS